MIIMSSHSNASAAPFAPGFGGTRFATGAEMGSESALVVFAKVLIAEQKHRMLMPGVLDLPQRLLAQRKAEIDAADFRPNNRMQLRD
jgi:hypothetical protein